MNYKKLLIISVAVLMILTSLTVLMDNQNNTQATEKTGITPTPENLVQGEVNQNGVLWIVSYYTPSEQKYPEPFQSFHSNNLTLEVYSPLNSTCEAKISVLSFLPKTINKNGTVINTETDPEYENQTFTIEPRQVMSLNLKIPQTPGKREVSITFDNNTVSYYITTYHNIVFPFSNPLEIVGIMGVIMLVFTAISLGITKIIIDKAKYFPPVSQRIWLGLIFITLIIVYQIVYNYYYDLTGEDWAILFIPLFIFDFLEILSVYPSKAANSLFIHIRDTSGSDIETGLYSIKTADMTEEEKGKFNIENEWLYGKEYIDEKSYKDFIKRLFGIQIPILMTKPEQPDEMDNVISLKVKEEPFKSFYAKKKKKKGRKYKPWKMIDRKTKDHPFTEALLLDPEQPAPIIKKLPITYKSRLRGKEKTKYITALLSYLDGKHMKESEYFLSNYRTASEAGKEIHRLSKENAQDKAMMSTNAYKFQKEIFGEIFKGTHEEWKHESLEDDKTRKIEKKGDEKNE